MKTAIRTAFAAVALLVMPWLAGCQTPAAQRLPEMTFHHLPPLSLDVADLRVEHAYRPPLADPFVEHLFPTPPMQALDRWARDRIRPVGQAGTAVFTILDASVRETRLETDKGLRAKVTTEQSERYDANVEALLEIFDGAGRSVGHARAKAGRMRTIAENASLNDRERMWYEMTEAMMADFNTEMGKAVSQFLAPSVR